MTRHGKSSRSHAPRGNVALVVLLAVWMAGPAQQPTPEEQREQKIIQRFLTVLEKNPRRGTALDRIYGYHVERGSLDQLIRTYRERAKRSQAEPGNERADGTASMIVGLLESQRGKDAEAVAAFRQAEKRLPQNALASYYLGQALVMVGQPDAAAEAFERAIARKPGRTDLLDIFQALGRVYQRAQRSDKALSVWSRLEQLFPDDHRVQEQIASTLAEEGQYDQALPRYEKLARAARDPYQKATFRMEAAELKVRLKQTAKALADFEALLGELNPDSWLHREVRHKIEDVFLRNDDQAGLAKYYESWVEKHPGDIDAIARLAHALSNQGRMPEAKTWLEKGIVKAPSRKQLRQALIEQLLFEQKYDEAAAQYEAMDKADPNNPDTLREWGKVLLRDKARPEAERKQAAYKVWRRLLEKRPKDPVITAQVADLVRNAGLVEEAVALYKRAIEQAPKSPQYREYLGEYLHSLKRSPEALAAWRPIAEGANRNAKNLARLGEVFNGFGYRKEAIAAFADAVGLEKDDFNLRLRYAELLHLDERNDDALGQIDAAEKLADNADEVESALQARIKVYQATDTLTAHTTELQKELDSGQDVTAGRWHRLARYYEANRQMAEATASIGKAIELDGKSLPILASAARIHESGGNLLLAADINRKLAALDRRFRTEYLTAVAKLEARLGRRTEALQAGRDLLAAAPGNPDHYKFYADLCFQLGEAEEGLEALRRSVRANPSDPQGLLALANALAERFRTGEAIELFWRAFDKTNDLDGKLPIIARLTELYLQQNQFDRLLERLERERREADKQREMTLCLAQAYQAAGDLGTARQQLERLLAENARDTQLLGQLSQLAESEGDTALALKYQRQFVQAAPNNHDGRLRLAQLLVKSGEAEEAAAIWVKLVADEPQPHRNLQAIDALLAHNNPQTVFAITRRLLAGKPGDWELLYREGAALGALHRTDEARQRFQALLDLRLADDEEGALLAHQKTQKWNRVSTKSSNTTTATTNVNQTTYNPDEVPLAARTESVWQVRAYTGLDPRYSLFIAMQQQQQRIWMPRDYGEARMAALAWLLGFAQKQEQGEAFLKAHRPPSLRRGEEEKRRKGENKKERAATDSSSPVLLFSSSPLLRSAWDWYYLQSLRLDWREVYKTSRELARSPDPAASFAYLHALGARTTNAGYYYYRPGRRNSPDTTPALLEEEIDFVLAKFQHLRKEKPQWLTTDVLTNVLTELKRARRSKDEEQVYRDAVATALSSGQLFIAQNVLSVAAERGDLETVLKCFERVERLQGGAPRVRIGTTPLRQAAEALGDAMRACADAKNHDALSRLYRAYLTVSRRQQKTSGQKTSRTPSSINQTFYMVYIGRNRQRVQIDFPQPGDYLDGGAIELLRNAFELYKRDDLLSDLFAHFRAELAKADSAKSSFPNSVWERVSLHLTLAAMHHWNHEQEEALDEMNAASELAVGDVNLRLEVARLREQNNELDEALAVLDSITPLDHTTMQQREIAALRLAERTGNVERARQAAERLFGLRLDAETQVQLAAQMHHLGMHDAAEKVLQRAQRQAGHRTAALVSLMHQYQSQNQIELALQIARKLLRKGPTTRYLPYYYYNNESDGRAEAIQVLVRSGKLGDSIARIEAQLKCSPQSIELHQALLEYYKASGDKTKIKEIAERMAKVRPDDGKLRFQLGEQLQGIGEFAAAAEHYRAGIRKEPMLFAYNYWEIQQVFDRLHKTEELIGLIEEIDLKSVGGNVFVFMNLLQPLFKQERTRPQGLRLFRKVWEAFPQERSRLLLYVYQAELWQVPEVYDYARQAYLPVGDDPVEPWPTTDQQVWYEGDGRVAGVVTRLLEAARRQNRLRPLVHDVEKALVKHPEWSAGKALLVILNLERGKIDEARRSWRELLEDKSNPIPLWSRYIFCQEIADFDAMRDLALQTYEAVIEESINDLNMNMSYSPLRRLVHLYRDMGRKADARALLLRCTRSQGWTFDSGYNAYQRISNTSAVASELTELGYAVDALRLCSELVNDRDTIQAAVNWNGPWMKEQAEEALRTAVKGLKPETLAQAVRDLLTPRARVEGGGWRVEGKTNPPFSTLHPPPARLDLLLLLQPRELPDAQLTSMLEQALHDAAKKPDVRSEAQATLKKLLVAHPDDLSVRIAAALALVPMLRVGTEKSATFAEAVERLARLLQEHPLEQLAKGQRANARQRNEAAQQIGVWLIARQCLRQPALRAVGKKLGERAVEAGRRQLEPHFALAMLREWGQIELDRGDRQAAERRWAEMLDVVLPQPANRIEEEKRRRGEEEKKSVSLLFSSSPLLLFSSAAAPKRQASGSKRLRGSAVTIEQFENAARVAMLAADQKMYSLSLRSLGEALRGGPPVSGAENLGRRRSIVAAASQPAIANDNNNQHNTTVAQRIAALVTRWQAGEVPDPDIYDVLAGVVLPEARPAEVFLYAPTTRADPTQPTVSVGQLLVAAAVKARRLDDLRGRTAARRDTPLGELNARVLLAHIAEVAKDEAGLRAALKDFGQRLQKDNLQHTAVLISQIVAPLLVHRELAAEARPVLERAAKNLIAAGAEDAAGNLLIFLARRDFEQGRSKDGQARLKEAAGLTRRTSNPPPGVWMGSGGQAAFDPRLQHVALEYIRADLLGDALDLFSAAADAPAEQRTRSPDDVIHNLLAAFARQLAKHPSKERYQLLKTWTMPAATRQSVRVLAGFAPVYTPPAAFGRFAAPLDGVVSLPDLLIESAQQSGQLTDLAAEVQKLAAKKVENADVLYALIQLANGKGATVEDVVKRQIDEVRKKVMAPPPVRSPFYYGPQWSGPSVEWAEFLLARACLRDERQAVLGETLADLLLWLAQGRSNEPDRNSSNVRFAMPEQNNSHWSMVIHLREALALRRRGEEEKRRRGEKVGISPLLLFSSSPLLRWQTAGYSDTASRHGGALPPWWIAHEGHIAHLVGGQDDFLVFDYPLTGTFEFSVDAFQGRWAEGHVGYAGMVFEPLANGGSLWPVGGHERLYLYAGDVLRRDSFNRFTIQVEAGKVRWLVNNRLVYEQTDSASTSPWLVLYAHRDRHTVFRNPRLRGQPHIPREVLLSHGDRLEGWVSKFYDESQPPRLSKGQQPRNRFYADPSTQNQDPSSFDWHAQNGEIRGRRDPSASTGRGVGSLLSYFRPLRRGETLRYEFFYRPGEVMVHPCLGRLAFLLGPEGVRLHWLTENDGSDWSGLDTDNAVEMSRSVSLKANEWNQLQLSLTADSVKIELNGAGVCERKLEASDGRPFGLFHYKNRTAARVRNVVLTGDWPGKLSEKMMADSFLHSGPVADGAVRRALIGDRFFLQSAGQVLRQARELQPEHAYELLQAWVLPNKNHALFQMAGEFTPADPAPPVARSQPESGNKGSAGRRVPSGGDLEAPALELVELAKKLGKLDELAQRVEQANGPELARGRSAMLALVRAAQERDEPARKALDDLGRLIAPLPLNEPIWRRWPELLAAHGTRNRPALRQAALALLDVQIKKLEESIARLIPLTGRDGWLSHVRQTRAALQVLGLSPPRLPFGDDPGLKFWDAVSHTSSKVRGPGAPRVHWTVGDGVVQHYPGRSHDYLYLRTPLQGDFDVSCELTSFGWREAHLAYGGLRLDLVHTLKRYNLYSFARLIRAMDIDPPLLDLGPWYKFRLSVLGEKYTVYINDRKICEEPLPFNPDPWLMLHAEHSNTAGIRNVKIRGTPRVPETLALSASPDLAGWLSYDESDWHKRGEEITNASGKPAQDPDQALRPRTWQEKALYYHRPLLEDGDIDYEFYYEPGKVLVHPAVDRLVFLLDPEGVRIHWLTDGNDDRTGLTPDNAAAEPKDRRGPSALPLEAKTWNHMKLSLSDDTITLHLNGTAIYERILESTNQRTFGLFHYAEDTSVRVRNVTYRGRWPRRLPDADELWAVKGAKK
jgi:tetratricopeptide (TPR) repeat protein